MIMKLKDLIERLSFHTQLSIRSTENEEICNMKTNSSAFKYFADREVHEWFPYGSHPVQESVIVVVLKDDSNDGDRKKDASCSEE